MGQEINFTRFSTFCIIFIRKRKHYAKLCENGGKVLFFTNFQRVLSQSFGVNQRLGLALFFLNFPLFGLKWCQNLQKEKNSKQAYFNQPMGCTAPIHQAKYTTVILPNVPWSKYQMVRRSLVVHWLAHFLSDSRVHFFLFFNIHLSYSFNFTVEGYIV